MQAGGAEGAVRTGRRSGEYGWQSDLIFSVGKGGVGCLTSLLSYGSVRSRRRGERREREKGGRGKQVQRRRRDGAKAEKI